MSLKENGMASGSISAGVAGDSSFEFISNEKTEVTLAIENVVSCVYDTVPLTGVYSPDYSIDGWIWDRRILPDHSDIKTMYNTYLGGHRYGLKEGVIQDYWQSGTVNGLELLKIVNCRDRDRLTWTPKVQAGTYAVFWELMKLFSDYSFTTKMDPLLLEDELMYFDLREDCFSDTVSVCIFTRDTSLIKRPYISFDYVEEFTGKIDESTTPSTRMSTVGEDGLVIRENIAERKYEFTIDDNNRLWLNGNHLIRVGNHTETLSQEILDEHYQSCGQANSSGRLCFSNYFPLASGETEVIIVNPDDSFQVLEEAKTLNFSESTDPHYSVDEDLGIITIGGYSAQDLLLSADVDEDDTEIPFFLDGIKSDGYPRQGIITIGSEKILYYNKGFSSFYDCVRGYDGTIPEKHSAYSVISDIQHGMSFSDSSQIYIRYTAIPRVQYEVTDHTERSGNNADYLNIKPVKNSVSNKIIQISSVEKHVDSIVLETSSELIGGNLHGPVYYGTDFSELCATVYDSVGNVVEDVETTIVLSPATVGTLNGTSSTYTALTNSAGQICAIYNAPYDWSSVSTRIKSVTHSGSDTIMTFEERPPGVSTEDVTVFQVLKHDPITGTVGNKVACDPDSGEIAASFRDGSSLGFCAFEVEGYFDDGVSQYEDGFVDLLVTYDGATIKYRRQIAEIIEQHDTDSTTAPYGESSLTGLKIVLTETIPHMDEPGALSYAWLYEKHCAEWNGTFLDGAHVVLYEWREDILNPNDMSLGAYYPLRPDEVQPTSMTFKDRTLTIPQPYEQDFNLGGYVAVIPDMVEFYAYAKDRVSGRIIVSNTIRIRLDLPAYLNGVDKSNPALPVPYGARFVTEDFNVGTGVGGANFLTINPRASGVNSYSLFITPATRGH